MAEVGGEKLRRRSMTCKGFGSRESGEGLERWDWSVKMEIAV